MEELDILTLDNGKDYVISKMLKYNDKEYLLLIQVDDEENLLDEKLIVERVKEFDDYYLKIVDDDNTKKIVSDKFAGMLLEDMK